MAAGIGDLVATLVADTKQWQSGLASAKSGLASFAKSAAVSLAGVAASFATIDFAKGALHAAEEDIRATRKLDAVLKSTGHSAGVTSEEVGKLATELQRLTGFEDDATMGAAALLATFTNVKGENFAKALRLSQDLAVVWEVDLLGAVKKLGKQIDDLKPEQVGAKLDELTAKFGGAAAEAQTATQKIGNFFGDMNERAGSEIEPIADLIGSRLIPKLYELGESFGVADTSIIPFIGSARALRDALEEVKVPKLNELMPGVANAAGGGAMNLLKETPFAEGGQSFFEDKVEDYAARIRSLKNEFAELAGVSKGELARRDAIADGLTPDQADTIGKKVDENETARKGAAERERMKRAAEELRQSLMTPGEKLEETLDGYRELLENGEIDVETFEKASGKAMDGFFNKKGDKPSDASDKGFAALQKGSAEAASAVFTAMRGDSVDKQILDAQEEEIALTEEANRHLENMSNNGVAIFAGSLA